MYKLLTLFAVLTFIYACTNTSANSANQPGTNPELPQSTGPDGSDLLKTLEGRWENQNDSTITLEFADTKMRRFQQGVLRSETDIEIDVTCRTLTCQLDTTDLLDGWCFMEKGPSSTQCYIVLDCTKELLKCSEVATPNLIQVFKKL